MEEGIWDCYVVYYGFVLVGFAGIWDGGEVVGRETLENGFEGRFSRSCVPIASQDRKREGSKEVVQFIEREREVLVLVEVEKVEVEGRGRNGNNKNVGILGKGNKGGLDDPTLLFPDASRQSFGFCRIVRKKPKVVVR